MRIQVPKIIFSVVVCHAAGLIGSFFTVSSVGSWYQTIEKPFFNPPNWLFGPVWLLLYTIMGIALYFVWQKGLERREVRTAFWLFIAHLVVNASWSLVFFGLQQIGIAFFVIVVLWVMIAVLLRKFWHIDHRAGWLMMPYFAWVTFAMFLNFAIAVLN